MEILRRGAVEIVSEEDLAAKLKQSIESGAPLRVKTGFDPTAPDIHFGHLVLLQKMKQFQDLGHEVIFLIGDFTGLIGDPTGRSETRPALSREQILSNAETYKTQVFKVLDPNKTRIDFNSRWMDPMTSREMIKLASRYTVARMLERDDYKKRFASGRAIHVHEFLYPLVQAYDSVALKADVELGGTDQIFNLLVGREIQRDYGQQSQVVLTVPLLVGMDGVQKMSKSLGNYIGINESAEQIYGKIMSISDDLMIRYMELLSSMSNEELEAVKSEMAGGSLNPKVAKQRFALEMASRFAGKEEALQAQAQFDQVFSRKAMPDEIETKTIESGGKPAILAKALFDAGLVSSRAEGKRMIQQGAVTVDGSRSDDPDSLLAPGEYVIKVGKRRFARVKIV